MAEKPILFSGEMVRSILDGRKTQTRRVMKPQPPRNCSKPLFDTHGIGWFFDGLDADGDCNEYWPENDTGAWCPYGKPDDMLWVRETFAYITKAKNEHYDKVRPDGCPVEMLFKADADAEGWTLPAAWTPSIFMPRWASRITLRVTGVYVERLWQMSVSKMEAEGVMEVDDNKHPLTPFITLWDSINAKRGYSWESNPWVWVVEFERLAT